METKDFFQDKNKSVNWQITLKVFIIGIVALALLVPKFMILGLINERQETAEITKDEVMQKWSQAQTVRGPVLTIPFIANRFDRDENTSIENAQTSYLLPKNLQIDGEIFPEKRSRSIYETAVYETKIKISGYFDAADFNALKISKEKVLWGKAKILVAISDLRGISNSVSLTWNNTPLTFDPGMENNLVGHTGISLPLPNLTLEDFPGKFEFMLHLKGSESLNFAPLGETTEVHFKSKWNDPGFDGNFLPTEHTINNDGFSANWKILHFNRNFPQEWKNNEYNVTNADFGVKLVSTADHYQKSARSAKYAILVILFTFLSFFLNEIINKQKIHPFQYILVGFAILIFYLLLLSLSEQIGFNPAYLISAISVIIMVLAYSRTFFDKWINTIIQTLILTFSFGFIFVLMQLETYALLVGSIGLFIVLALTMFFTRKIKWYSD